MRALLIFWNLCLPALLLAQRSVAPVLPQVLINEVQAADGGLWRDADGRSPDRIELYNPSHRPSELAGMRLALGGRQHVFQTSLVIPPKGHRVLSCDANTRSGADHVWFSLPRSGGTLLLIAADGGTILDVFTWRDLPVGMSQGRVPDGAATWSLLETPSLGVANTLPTGGELLRGRWDKPTTDLPGGFHAQPIAVLLNSSDGADVHYTLDGTSPSPTNGMSVNGPIAISHSSVLRARSYGAGKAPGPERCDTYIIGPEIPDIATLVLEPSDLWSDSIGIDRAGYTANHSRTGSAWERPGYWHAPDGEMLPVGVRISGSGTRSRPKRSFKLYLRDRYEAPVDDFAFEDGTHCDEGILRADASPHAFLRNQLLEVLVRTYSLHLEVQPSIPVQLFVNERYWGLYRWMPPKDAQWLCQRSGAEAVDVLEGPAATALSGSSKKFIQAQQMLLRSAPKDSLEAMIDLPSLIDLACIDLWTGRADQDLNVRVFRPRVAGGRWRWVLFDMDLWSSVLDNTVERLCSAAAPETPYVPELLGHEALRPALLARFTALQATAFAPEVALAVIDSIHAAHVDVMLADHRRWDLELEPPHPDETREDLRTFIGQRHTIVMQHLAKRTGHALREVVIEVPAADRGQVLLEGLALPPGRRKLLAFTGVPLHVEARPAAGHSFIGWKGVEDADASVTLDLARQGRLAPRFVPVQP